MFSKLRSEWARLRRVADKIQDRWANPAWDAFRYGPAGEMAERIENQAVERMVRIENVLLARYNYSPRTGESLRANWMSVVVL